MGERRAGGTIRRLGGLPQLVPASLGEGCPRAVLVEADRCAPLVPGQDDCGVALQLPDFVLATPVASLGVVPWGSAEQPTGLFAFGGRERDDRPVAAVQLFDRVDWVAGELDRSDDPLGPSTPLPLATDAVAFLDEGQLRLFVGAPLTPVEGPALALHRGGGLESTALLVAPGLAAVLGGAGTDGITWVGFTEDEPPELQVLGETRLAIARTRPLAVALSGGVLVVGGVASGEPLVEWVPTNQDGIVRSSDGLSEVPERALLVAGPDENALLLGGGPPDAPVPTDATVRLEDCAVGPCVVSNGPRWLAPRFEPSVLVTPDATWLVGGRDALGPHDTVEQVLWPAGGDPEFLGHGPLATARADAAVVRHAAGTVLVLGGEGAGGELLDTIEICAPSTLPPSER